MTTEHFTGTLPVSGLRFYSFNLSRDSDYRVLLASLSTTTARALPDLQVGIGVGIPAGTTCDVNEQAATTTALTRQLAGVASKGIHCVAIFDLGHLPEPVSFAIRLAHY